MPLHPADYQRFSQLYYYLCACLAMKQKADGTPNYKAISDRLGSKADFRKTVSALFKDLGGKTAEADVLLKISSITTSDVVTMLAKLDENLKTDYRNHDEDYTRILTADDVLTVLFKLIELTPDERQELGLSASDGLTLLQRALLILQTAGGLENYEMIFRIYKAAVGLEFARTEPLTDLEQVDSLIAQTVDQILAYLPARPNRNRNNKLPSPSRDKTIEDLTQKAKREIRRLLARSGNQQNPVSGNVVVNSYIRHYLQPAFVVKLAQTVVANERLTDQFPVYLKRITIEACGPLPFVDKGLAISQHSNSSYPPLFHPMLWQFDHVNLFKETQDLSGPGDYDLTSQEATKIVVEFYVKLSENYQPAVNRVFHHLASGQQRRIDFSLSSTGIGGALSHVIKVVNLALLSDISCLTNYFPIAHDVTSTQQIIRENVPSPVWAHSLVKLCHKDTLAKALQACDRDHLSSYEAFAFAEPIGHGDYCGFDFLLSQAQAALHARLQAIRNAGVVPANYITEMARRTEYLLALQNAWSYLQGYPFSSMAMIGVIHQEIWPSDGTIALYGGKETLRKTNPYIHFDACLSIIEALLDEGAYRPARHYLRRIEVIEDYVQQGLAITQSNVNNALQFEVFSGALIIRYLLCKATYCYLYDTRNSDPRYLPLGATSDINRRVLVQEAWTILEQAQQHASVRLQKYVVLNEVSQGTFHPHYSLLGRIASLRAKLLLFFPYYVPRSDQRLPTEYFLGQQRAPASIHWGRLYLFEKARLYAAADGDSEVYACYSAMQCWVHLMAVYSDEKDLTLPTVANSTRTTLPKTLSARDCLKWAKRLRDHALISYAEAGRQCYYQVKEKSGLPKDFDEFGAYRIQKLPAIYEARGEEYVQLSRRDSSLLTLDMALLAVNPDDLPKVSPNHPDRTIYLFGTNACYLFFARGMYLLCSNAADEFKENQTLTSVEEWREKLNRAMRLFDMAWAIAEEGGDIQKENTGEDAIFSISRPLSASTRSNEYTSSEVDSVRDLYPRRITEIADLGKVFAATCMALCLHMGSSEEREQILTNIDKIVATLHGVHRLHGTSRALMARQKRYNGQLESCLEQIVEHIRHHALTAHVASTAEEVMRLRDALVKSVFSVLMA